MEAILEAHKAYQEAYRKVWHDADNPKAAWYGSDEQKALREAKREFRDAVHASVFSEVFLDYEIILNN